jgi:glutaryl-CoA dehydrogenase
MTAIETRRPSDVRSQDERASTQPPATGDFYGIASTLSAEDQVIVQRVRAFMETEVAPIINRYWVRAEFPFELIPKFAALDIAGISYKGYGCAGKSTVLDGMIALEMARVDPSIATFFGVHSGLAMGSIYLCGSEAQKRQWLPPMRRMEKIGAFGLTEPEVGSGAAGGLMTTARRDGDSWVLNGQKKWIGNATFADVTVIWARDEADNQVKGFLVEKGTPGFIAEKMEDKMALRVVQNALITLRDCRVPKANRLQKAHTFRDTAAVLRMTRASVAWQAVGCAMGAYEHALSYARRRQQFGRPIGSHCMTLRLSQMQDAGDLRDEHASLAKAYCTAKCRETVGFARELLGGNGILLEHQVGRFVADAEAIYSYEGTREMNTLIVGRAVTGFSAFA